ncbi:MAG: MOSC domain-containing protein, partial [Nitrosomonadales bacterium]|nr:MOSC domain-containing protein [Nitrosomonadales bacterium]
MPQKININGREVLTAIYKTPVQNRIRMRKLNLEGDGQADLTVHGGEHQAVYSYPFEHYSYWQQVLKKPELAMGTFGENLTVSGLLETEVYVGDILQIGEGADAAVVQITMPRIPCFKFGHKVGRPDILDEFLLSGRSGFYQRVLTEGEIGAGD